VFNGLEGLDVPADLAGIDPNSFMSLMIAPSSFKTRTLCSVFHFPGVAYVFE